MKASLVGIHKVSPKLANGQRVVYFYAWRGGPRINAKPNTREFLAEYTKLTRSRPIGPYEGKLAELLREYTAKELPTLSEGTQASYQSCIDEIESEYFDLPLEAFAVKGMRREILNWRDGFKETPRKADLIIAVFSAILSYGLDKEFIDKHPLLRVKKLSSGTRRDKIWTDKQVSAFMKSSKPHMRMAMDLARWTGQRQADLLSLTWSAYQNGVLEIRQGKTGKLVRFAVPAQLRDILDRARKKTKTVTILANSRNQAWTKDGFKTSWGKACKEAKVEGVTFHDLRGTFITLLRRQSPPVAYSQIALISGHAEDECERVMKLHYEAASAPIIRLQRRTKR